MHDTRGDARIAEVQVRPYLTDDSEPRAVRFMSAANGLHGPPHLGIVSKYRTRKKKSSKRFRALIPAHLQPLRMWQDVNTTHVSLVESLVEHGLQQTHSQLHTITAYIRLLRLTVWTASVRR